MRYKTFHSEEEKRQYYQELTHRVTNKNRKTSADESSTIRYSEYSVAEIDEDIVANHSVAGLHFEIPAPQYKLMSLEDIFESNGLIVKQKTRKIEGEKTLLVCIDISCESYMPFEELMDKLLMISYMAFLDTSTELWNFMMNMGRDWRYEDGYKNPEVLVPTRLDCTHIAMRKGFHKIKSVEYYNPLYVRYETNEKMIASFIRKIILLLGADDEYAILRLVDIRHERKAVDLEITICSPEHDYGENYNDLWIELLEAAKYYINTKNTETEEYKAIAKHICKNLSINNLEEFITNKEWCKNWRAKTHRDYERRYLTRLSDIVGCKWNKGVGIIEKQNRLLFNHHILDAGFNMEITKEDVRRRNMGLPEINKKYFVAFSINKVFAKRLCERFPAMEEAILEHVELMKNQTGKRYYLITEAKYMGRYY